MSDQEWDEKEFKEALVAGAPIPSRDTIIEAADKLAKSLEDLPLCSDCDVKEWDEIRAALAAFEKARGLK